jgi:hypothetical protein
VCSLPLKEDRFGFEPEFVAKVARLGLRVLDMPISCYGRTRSEAKKICWKNGLRALYCIVHYSAWRAMPGRTSPSAEAENPLLFDADAGSPPGTP